MYALSSASLTYTMARACASGSIYQCTCAENPTDLPLNDNFQWGGCGDNLKWGASFAKRFIDNAEKYNAQKILNKLKRDNSAITKEERAEKVLKNQMAIVNLHNNRVGRKVIIFLFSFI